MSNHLSVSHCVPAAIALGLALLIGGCGKDDGKPASSGLDSLPGQVPASRADEAPSSPARVEQTSALDTVMAAYETYGLNDPRSYDAYTIAMAACEDGRGFSVDNVPPQQADATLRLQKMCEGFSSDNLQKPTARIKSFSVPANATPAQKAAIVAEAKAAVLNRGAQSRLESIGAAMLLTELGEFPGQDTYGVDRAELLSAYGVASTLRQCRLTGCGPNSYQAVVMCRSNPCDASRGYEGAVRQIHSPQQMQLIERLAAL